MKKRYPKPAEYITQEGYNPKALSPEATAAIRASVKKYRDKAKKGEHTTPPFSPDCPLCQYNALVRKRRGASFFPLPDDCCSDCPVRMATGEAQCYKTPWWDRYINLWEEAHDKTKSFATLIRKTLRDKLNRAATAEADFLEALLPHRRKPTTKKQEKKHK